MKNFGNQLNFNMEKINNISEESKQFKDFANILQGNDENLTNLKTLLQKKRKNFQMDSNFDEKNSSIEFEEYQKFLKIYFHLFFEEKSNIDTNENFNDNKNGNCLKSLSFTMKEDLELNESFNSFENENNNNEKHKLKEGLKIIGLVNKL
jgi:hypothetical protein